MPLSRRLATVLAAGALVFTACSDGDSDAVAADDDSTDSSGSASSTEGRDGGTMSLTVDGETWSFDGVRCAVGEAETGVEGAEFNASGSDGSIHLYVNVETGRNYVELSDLDDTEGDGIVYTTTGVGTPEPDIVVDGSSFSADAEFWTMNNDTGGLEGPFAGSLTGDCAGRASDGSTDDGDDSADSERPFDIDREDLATALAAGTRADDYEVDGTTIRLIFEDGSVDDPTAAINCRVANDMKDSSDAIELVYSDGVIDCDGEEW